MNESLMKGWLPLGLPNDIPTLRRMIHFEEHFATDKANLKVMERKLKRLEAK